MGGNKPKYTADGKWVCPFQKNDKGNFSISDFSKEKFEAKGQFFKEIGSRQDLLEVMQLIEATRTAKSHALNDRSSRSHCVVIVKQVIKKGNS